MEPKKISELTKSNIQFPQTSMSLTQVKTDPLRRYPVDPKYIDLLKIKFKDYLKDQFFFDSDELKQDKETNKALKTIFDWILGSFEPKKGFILTGSFGTGKSSIMKAAMALIFEMYGKSDFYLIGINEPKYITSKKLARIFIDGERTKINELIYSGLLGIDDFGYESKEVRSFGTVVFPLEEIIMERYDKKKIILATTNLSPKQIEKIYGGHVLDRLNQMCFWIEINTPSKRT